MFKLVTTGLFTGTEYVDVDRDSEYMRSLYNANVRAMNSEDSFSAVALYMWVEGVGNWHLMESARPEWAHGTNQLVTLVW